MKFRNAFYVCEIEYFMPPFIITDIKREYKTLSIQKRFLLTNFQAKRIRLRHLYCQNNAFRYSKFNILIQKNLLLCFSSTLAIHTSVCHDKLRSQLTLAIQGSYFTRSFTAQNRPRVKQLFSINYYYCIIADMTK